VEHLRDSNDGLKPEVPTFYQRSPLRASPQKIAYHYEYGAPQAVEHYPVAAGALVVTVADWPHGACQEEPAAGQDCATRDPRRYGDLYDARPVLKAYVGSELVGRFELGDLVVPPGEGNRTSWMPLVVEYGFTDANPDTA